MADDAPPTENVEESASNEEPETVEVAQVLIKPAWISDEVRYDLIKDFPQALNSVGADISTNFSTAYASICEKHGIVPCPFVNVRTEDNGTKVLRLLHCDIDISNWRALLMAAVASDPPVTDFIFHGSKLSVEHLQNLKLVLERKPNTCNVLKFSNVVFVGAKYSQALCAVLQCGGSYVSLKHCDLTSEFIDSFTESCATKVHLQVLDLTGNHFTDEDAEKIFESLYLNVALKHLILKKNSITGSCFKALGKLVTGRLSIPEDQNVLKSAQKAIADKNKWIKEHAKARKSAGLPDIPELPLAESRIFKIGADAWIVNRGMATINLGENPITFSSIRELAEVIATQEPSVAADKVNGHCSTVVSLKNLVRTDGIVVPPPTTEPYAVVPQTYTLTDAERKELKGFELEKGVTLAV